LVYILYRILQYSICLTFTVELNKKNSVDHSLQRILSRPQPPIYL